MNIQNNEFFRGFLVTQGRKTRKQHKVILRGVKYNDKFYFSRHRPDGDWFQNAIANSDVEIEYNGKTIRGKAKQVQDEQLEKKISELKYPGEERSKEKRVAIEITQYEQ